MTTNTPKQVELANLLIAQLDMMIKSSTDTIDKFKSTLDENPVYAFEWAESSMKAAAKLQCYTQVKNAMEWGMSEEPAADPRSLTRACESILKTAHENVMRGAKYGHNSSSAVSNLMGYAALSCWADMLDNFMGSSIGRQLEAIKLEQG